MTKQTQGAWAVEGDGNYLVAGGERVIGQLFARDCESLDEACANARLITAAPALLEALEKIATGTAWT